MIFAQISWGIFICKVFGQLFQKQRHSILAIHNNTLLQISYFFTVEFDNLFHVAIRQMFSMSICTGEQ